MITHLQINNHKFKYAVDKKEDAIAVSIFFSKEKLPFAGTRMSLTTNDKQLRGWVVNRCIKFMDSQCG